MQKPPDWLKKFDPAFPELAEFNLTFEREWHGIQQEHKAKQKALGRKAPLEVREKLARHFQRVADEFCDKLTLQLVDINRRYPHLTYNPLAYSYFETTPGEPIDENRNLFAYFHWSRHRESLRATEAKDSQGDIKAYRKLARTGEDFRRAIHKKGPIKPFKGDEIHRQLLELILCFQIESLTPDELAECLDKYCVCGKIHDADAARKQLARLRRELEASNPPHQSATSGESPSKRPKTK